MYVRYDENRGLGVWKTIYQGLVLGKINFRRFPDLSDTVLESGFVLFYINEKSSIAVHSFLVKIIIPRLESIVDADYNYKTLNYNDNYIHFFFILRTILQLSYPSN